MLCNLLYDRAKNIYSSKGDVMQHYFLLSLLTFSTFTCYSNIATQPITFQSTESYNLHNKENKSSESFEEAFQHANNLFTTEHYKDAAHFYKKALTIRPTCAHTFFNLGQAY